MPGGRRSPDRRSPSTTPQTGTGGRSDFFSLPRRNHQNQTNHIEIKLKQAEKPLHPLWLRDESTYEKQN
jgi:hypothetical protein